MPDGVALALALVILAATLAAAVTRPPNLSEAVVATIGAAVLLIVGVVGLSQVGDAVGDLGPTVVFLAALLVIADVAGARVSLTPWALLWPAARGEARSAWGGLRSLGTSSCTQVSA